MGHVVDCPSCTRKLRLPADLLGRMVRCASCGGTFEAKESSTPTPPPPAPEPAASDRPSQRSRPRRDSFDDTEPCPRCGEEIPADSTRCRHCGELLEQVEDRPWERGVRRDCEPHRAGLELTLGIISIVCGALGLALFCCTPLPLILAIGGLACSIPAWVMGQQDLAKMRNGVMDPRGRGTAQGGWICGIIGTILSTLALLLSAGVIVLFVIQAVMAPAMPTSPPPPPRTVRPGRGIGFDPGLKLPMLLGRKELGVGI